jgi:hypothetical protein
LRFECKPDALLELSRAGIARVGHLHRVGVSAVSAPAAGQECVRVELRRAHELVGRRWSQLGRDRVDTAMVCMRGKRRVVDKQHVCVCVCVCVCDRSYTGFDNLGTIAGEVINPSYTYPRGVVGALLIIAVSMSMPIIVSSLVADRVCACACACVYA